VKSRARVLGSAPPMPRFLSTLAALLVALLFAIPGHAAPVSDSQLGDRTEQAPKQLQGVAVTEHLGQNLPLDLAFKDSTGRDVKLRDYFDGKHPVIITLNYSNCPMLCSLELSGLAKGMKELEWSAGKEFRVVTVSLDPTETKELGAKTRARYLGLYGRPGAESGWAFLRGSEDNVRTLAKAIGFSYNYDPEKKQYYHPAVIALGTPKGMIARYLYGIVFHPQTLRLALVESSQGKIGTTIDKILLYCCAYDAKEGNYSLVASKVMSLGGALTVIVLGSFLGSLWLYERRKRKKLAEGGTT
jgi:protein SCO1/2